ncbi:head-to-tail stopper [Gordonia phage Rabbitrun]|uniref:Head-to-tail stopper n=1 Tax=Gordonia phage Rabbitrun TaxID=2762280 RepID=A0A7G8LIJ2_9CAUD|nr:head-to-tail stopper [Gordonia phage Rabbitrun]QNJ57064.1 head-to-tail stopper [Gordonia phage Rabbitrun]
MNLLFNGADASTITVLRRGMRDEFGDPIGDEFSDSHTIRNVLIDYETTTSDRDRREEYTVRGTLRMPIGSDVLPTDRVELPDGERVVVEGKPFIARLGFASGMAVRFKGVR